MEQDKYIKLSKYHLRNYNYYQQAVKNIENLIHELDLSLCSIPARISTYGLNAGGGNSEFNEIERMADKRMKLEEQKNALSQDLRKLNMQLQALDKSIDLLPPDEKEALVMFYIKRYKYPYICEVLHFSERCVRNKIHNAVKGIAIMLFGYKACDTI